jgi:hypothetical protein
MSSKHPRNDGPVRLLRRLTEENPPLRGPETGRPVEPRDGGDNGRPTVKTWRDVLKILVAVTVWFATTDAAAALREASRYVDLGKVISLLHLPLGSVPNVVLWGFVLGLAHGLILGIKALAFIWVGPTFFEFLYPVFVAASRISARVVTDVRTAWRDRVGPLPPVPPIDPPPVLHTTDGGGTDTGTGTGEQTETTERTDQAPDDTRPTDTQPRPNDERPEKKDGGDNDQRK